MVLRTIQTVLTYRTGVERVLVESCTGIPRISGIPANSDSAPADLGAGINPEFPTELVMVANKVA
jgi:hypothetical protein